LDLFKHLDSLHFEDFYRNLGYKIIGRLGVPITCCHWLRFSS